MRLFWSYEPGYKFDKLIEVKYFCYFLISFFNIELIGDWVS